jgi:hypothetical protein
VNGAQILEKEKPDKIVTVLMEWEHTYNKVTLAEELLLLLGGEFLLAEAWAEISGGPGPWPLTADFFRS